MRRNPLILLTLLLGLLMGTAGCQLTTEQRYAAAVETKVVAENSVRFLIESGVPLDARTRQGIREAATNANSAEQRAYALISEGKPLDAVFFINELQQLSLALQKFADEAKASGKAVPQP